MRHNSWWHSTRSVDSGRRRWSMVRKHWGSPIYILCYSDSDSNEEESRFRNSLAQRWWDNYSCCVPVCHQFRSQLAVHASLCGNLLPRRLFLSIFVENDHIHNFGEYCIQRIRPQSTVLLKGKSSFDRTIGVLLQRVWVGYLTKRPIANGEKGDIKAVAGALQGIQEWVYLAFLWVLQVVSPVGFHFRWFGKFLADV